MAVNFARPSLSTVLQGQQHGVICAYRWNCLDPQPVSALASNSGRRYRYLGMVMFKRFAAAPLIAGAIIVLTTAVASAFSQQTITPNGNGNYNFDLDDKTKLNENTNKSDPNSQGFHFSVQSGQTGPFGSHSFGGSGNDRPPDYWAPLGRGN
jgi:hypothetical protein